MAARVLKLQYALTATLATASMVIVRRIMAGAGADFGVGIGGFAGADADRYGNVMYPNTVGAATALLPQRMVSAWFQCASTTFDPEAGAPTQVCVDFISETAPDPVVATGIDSWSQARPRVRVKLRGQNSFINGTLYVEKQHTEEI